ncbi:cell division ATP-binding protein FtsE [Desulfobulbus rhabdoformis]|jgi:cell division transport system ATP-binding protein|uniref:cell division ATP-binding protein FtsE n=1 Tax=Desulfobulbus rhabdoformis TaxID=34032 RepID=UPI0019661EB0|nr:cell division ATP-binding protein FtsE [Desulfobulbus rhabdoformis]MBM9616195.1 cell division ATP-binding protein FtsE [Desulfobulbus rhabdoformis]
MASTTIPPDVMIDLIKVSKTYPPEVQALVDVSLSIQRGEIVYLTGMSGAGKTTLLRLISRMEKPTKGMIDVAGFDLGKLPQRNMHLLRRKIGMAYQDFKLLPERTVADNIAIAMEVLYTPKRTMERRTRELLEQLDLSHKYATRAGELSRGEQQRVTIARAVANVPEIILADEPTGNLDGETTARVMDLFYRLNRKGSTLLIATHDTRLYRHDKDRVIELRFGRLQSAAQTRVIKAEDQPETTEIQEGL